MAGLEDLYREIILDHYRSPRNRGELDSPPAQRTEGFNPLCGDEVVVTIQVEDGKLSDIVWGTIPFHLLMFVLLIALVFWPDIALWLPNHMSAPP